MSLRTKVLLLAYMTTITLVVSLTAWDVYRIKTTVQEVMLQEAKDYAKTEAIYIADSLYYGDYDRIEEFLEINPVHQIKDMFVLNREGYIIASKGEGLILFERYPGFEEMEGIKNLTVVEKPESNLFVIIQPVKFEEEILGYLILLLDNEYYSSLIRNKVLMSVGAAALSLLLILLIVRYADAKFSSHLNYALKMLEKVGRGNFDLPNAPETGDEFERLYEEIKETAKRLKDTLVSRDYYMSLINSLYEGLIVVSKGGVVVEVNDSLCKLLNRSRDNLVGRNISEVFPELFSEIESLLKGKELKRSKRLKLVKSGEEKYFLLLISQYKDLFIITVNDITQMVNYEKKLEELSQKDHLTGVFNRRAIEDILTSEIERAHRYGRPLSVVFMDLDNFKQVNDKYGHDVGDLVLKNIAEVVQKELRNTDVFGRWGGEEFLIVMPETGVKGAVKLAERIRRAVENSSFGQPERITASFGVAQLEDEDTLEALVKRADEALYRAKREGKNRVEMGI